MISKRKISFTSNQTDERAFIGSSLQFRCAAPHRETGNVDTWKLKVISHPEKPNMPMQRINIVICDIPSYDTKPMMLRNHYGMEMGTSGLILQAESREEILANKLVALALRPNRIKNRDLWDIAWLRQQAVDLPLELVVKKIADHRQEKDHFAELLGGRVQQLRDDDSLRVDFVGEMRRFLPPEVAKRTVENGDFWVYLSDAVLREGERVLGFLGNEATTDENFRM